MLKRVGKKQSVFGMLLLAVTTAAVGLSVSVQTPAPVQTNAYNTSAFLNTVSYNGDEFTVALDASAPEVRDHYKGGGWSKADYQGRSVPMDEGKKGLLITSKQSGSAVDGKSFSFGYEMSGEFSIDFRLLAENGFTHQASGDIGNPYADVQSIVFTFTDSQTLKSFDVVINAGGAADAEKNTPEMYVTLPDGTKQGHRYGDEIGEGGTESDWLSPANSGWYTRLDGTSFANTAEVVSTGRFTAGAKSTSFSFNPATMEVAAARYERTGTLEAADKYTSPTTSVTQDFDGRCYTLRQNHLRVLDLDDEPVTASRVTGFDRYTVKVTFAKVTPNDTVAPDAEGETTYDRYAKMYIYSLNNVDLTGQELIESRADDIQMGEAWKEVDDETREDCLLAYATFNKSDYDWSEVEEAGIILSGYEKSFKYPLDTTKKQPDENGRFGMAIYNVPSGDYVVSSYVIYRGRMITTNSQDVRYVAKGALADLKISSEAKILEVGGEATVNVNVFDKDILWESSNEAVATVEMQTDKAYAKITAHALGEADITASVDGAMVTCKVSVKEIVLTGVPASKTVAIDARITDTHYLRIGVSGSEDKALTYVSSDDTIATVNSAGVITAKKKGNCKVTVSHASGEKAEIDVYVTNETLPNYIYTGTYGSYHVQGMSVDVKGGYTYYTFTSTLVKLDMDGNLVGTMTGFPGHMGDCSYNEEDGKLYATLHLEGDGSYDWSKEMLYYVAIIDVSKITSVGMSYKTNDLMKVVHLKNIQDYAEATLDGGLTGKFGVNGLDGCELGPKFGSSTGKTYLTVSAGAPNTCVDGVNTRDDNDYQVIWQYDISNWWTTLAQPFDETNPPKPEATADGEYFLLTGNGNFGIQDICYDAYTKQWFFITYGIQDKEYQHWGYCFVVSANSQPKTEVLKGQPTTTEGKVLQFVPKGDYHAASGIYSFGFYEASSGITSIGNGYFYVSIAKADPATGKQCADVYKYKWTGVGVGFERVEE